MGKRGKPQVKSSLFENVRRVQETYGNATSSLDQLVDRLRITFPKYRRHKLQPFTRKVKQTLDSSNITGKKRRIELHESESSSSESQYSDDGEEDRIAVLTSEDDAYSLKSEPEFDLTKSMLRNNYSLSKIDDNVDEKETERVDLRKEYRRDKAQKVNNLSNDDANGRKVDGGPRFKDLGGMDVVLNELKKRVIIPLYHPQLLHGLGVRPTGGILLHGPPGCGKTTLAHAIANELRFPFYKISAPHLVSGISGESEENIRELFSKAYKTAPSIVFIDEIDAIASKRENLQRGMERRIVTQLMTCMDHSYRVAKPDNTSKNLEASGYKPGHVLVIGATNHPDVLDPALRRPGRFDREIALGFPDENARLQILKVISRGLKLEGDFDLKKVSRMTPGFVATDLERLANEAGELAAKRIIDERELELSKESEEENEDWWMEAEWHVEKNCITMLDFEVAAKQVQPSFRREGFSSIPNVKWEDVGGLDALRREFDRYIVRRIKYPDEYEKFGVDLEMGFLLYGPPGCGKTLIAKAVANEAGANFIHIKGPEVLNKYVGESELAVRTIFKRARECSPCILFLDEVDALTKKRGKEEGSAAERLLNQLLVELDGGDQRKGVYVIGATNRPEVMDQALLRPGRFGKLLYVPLPNPDERGSILKAVSRKKPLDADVDLIAIGRSEACANLSGADLSALMNEAALAALEERFNEIEAANEPQSSLDSLPCTIKAIHFEQVLGKIPPSVSDERIQYHHLVSH